MPALALIPALLFGLVALIWQIISQVVAILIRPVLNHLNALDPDVPMPPPDAADGVERGRWSLATGAGMAASSGVSETVFGQMVDLVGEPPGIDQMLSLNRRGLLDTGTLKEMIAYSRIRTEWTNFVELLAHETMSTADALEAVLKGVIPQADGQTLFEQAGGLSDQFATLLATSGNPIGVEAANALFNHGLITDAELSQVILHSRINPQFEAMAKLLRFHYLSAFQIETGLKAGTITPDEGTKWLLAEGYPADQVAGLVAGAHAAKTVTHKTATEAQIAEAYDAGILSAAQAEAQLVSIGYDQGETSFILALYDYKRALAMDQAAIGQVRKVYLAHRVTDNQASNMLDALGVDAFARDHYLAIWKIEGEAELRELTAAQVGSMFKKGLMTDQQALARWTGMGYDQTDAELLLANYGGNPPPGSPAAIEAAQSSG